VEGGNVLHHVNIAVELTLVVPKTLDKNYFGSCYLAHPTLTDSDSRATNRTARSSV